MRLVGLTGGIASGKSTVSSMFKYNNIPVVDADVIARVRVLFFSSLAYHMFDEITDTFLTSTISLSFAGCVEERNRRVQKGGGSIWAGHFTG